MERCYRDTTMPDEEREGIKIMVFSRSPVSELQVIFPKEIFTLSL
jgi:hypothetical protein